MVPILSLWLPIVVSAVAVFVVSSVIHMAFTYHNSDFDRLPQEDEVRAALRPYKLPPSDYSVPYAGSMKAMQAEDFKRKMEEGPVFMMTAFPNGQYKIAGNMVNWFLYIVVISIVTALVAASGFHDTFHPRHLVFHLAALTAFSGYSLALLQNSIWWRRKWSTTIKGMFDGLIYAVVTALVFVWLWPH